MGERLLVVDDEAVLRRNVVRFLSSCGHVVDAAGNVEEALQLLAASDYALVVTDLKMPGSSGLELLQRIVQEDPQTLVLIMTAYASLESAIEALRLGAQDYLLKPLSLDDLGRRVERLLAHRTLELRVRRLREELRERYEPADIVAASASMQAVLELVRKVAPTPSNVLIEGESGTGKELVARALHEGSERRAADFVPVNLAAQPADLVDATLFGHERGAFTGATAARPGVFRAAAGGTVFLDEVGELPPAVQVKLLRVIESREVMPLGSDRPVPVDFRLVVATNRPLAGLVEAGTFREDLFFRLNVVQITLPPLRDRPEDVGPLSAQLLERHARSLGRTTPRLTRPALRQLQAAGWPGNVRELSNVLERAVLLGDGAWIEPDDLPAGPAVPEPDTLRLKDVVEAAERGHIAAVLAGVDGDKGRAAELLGVHLATLYRHLDRLGLS